MRILPATVKFRLIPVAAGSMALLALICLMAIISLTGTVAKVEAAAQKIYDVAMPHVFDAMREVRMLERLATGGRTLISIESPVERKKIRGQLESIAIDGVLQGDARTRETIAAAFTTIDQNLLELERHGVAARAAALQRWQPVEDSLNDLTEGIVAQASTTSSDYVDAIFEAIQNSRAAGQRYGALTVTALLTGFGLFIWLVAFPIVRLTRMLRLARDGRPLRPGVERTNEMQLLDDAAIALAEAHRDLTAARDELEMQANTDQLTGLANRRRFATAGNAELARSRRYARPLSLLAVDIDFFKRINDTFGHDGGDLVLEKIARLLRETVRDQDWVARMGGEEFAVVLPEVELEHARQAGERLRAEVAAMTITMPNGQQITITASFGVATAAPDENDIHVILQHADRALYRAKEGGRNRVEVAD